jgi:outer membrane protein TolC
VSISHFNKSKILIQIARQRMGVCAGFRCRLSLLFGFSILALVPGVSFANDLTLKHLLSEIELSSLELQKSQAEEQLAWWKYRETWSVFMPSLALQLNYLTDKKYVTTESVANGVVSESDQKLMTTQYLLTASLPLFDGFASTHKFNAGEENMQAARSEKKWIEYATQRKAVLAFYRALGELKLQESANQNLRILREHLKDAQLIQKTGMSTAYDVLRIDAQVADAESAVIAAEDAQDQALLELAALQSKDREDRHLVGELPIPSDDVVVRAKKIFTQFDQDASAGVISSLTSRYDLLAHRHRRQGLQELASAAKSHWLPRLSLFAEYGYYNNRNDRFSDLDAFRDNYKVGVNLIWNLFDGFSSSSKAEIAESAHAIAQIDLQSQQLEAKRALERAIRKIEVNVKIFQAKKIEVARASEAMRLAQASVKAGVMKQSELLDAELDLFRSQGDVIRAQMAVVEAAVAVELSTGARFEIEK